jgi:hypothetical protein
VQSPTPDAVRPSQRVYIQQKDGRFAVGYIVTNVLRPASQVLLGSVPDPNPDPPDPHVFGPPGSFCHHAKIVRKTLTPTIL